ncbi:Pituitary tumor-transforming 1 interacting protein [Chamberlinius hualienensis]
MSFNEDSLFTCLIIFGCLVLLISSENATTATTADVTNPLLSTEPSTTTTTTLAPELVCQNFNNSCEECVKHSKCYYCYTTNLCLFYPFSTGIPSSRDCDIGQVRWGVCWFNFKALIISLGVMGGVLLVSLCCCVYCCCRRKKRTGRTQQDAKMEREKEVRKIRADER